MKYLFCLFLLFSVQCSIAQIVLDKNHLDFENLYSYNEYFADVVFTNKGSKNEYILRVQHPKETTFKLSTDLLKKDSVTILRIQVNPTKLGKFSYEVNVFTSDKNEATKITLVGVVKEFPENSLAFLKDCPSFSDKPSSAVTNFKMTVVTIDEDTKEVLSQSAVLFLQNGLEIGQFQTDKNGQIVTTIPLGFTYFVANHAGYLSNELGSYVNFNRNKVVIPLKRMIPETVPVPPIEIQIAVIPEPPIEIVEQKTPISVPKDTVLIVEIPPVHSSIKQLDSIPFTDFDPTFFKQINVVFVLDISSSMVNGERLELMKHALYKLIEYMRPDDKMGIVTYASTTNVLLQPEWMKNINRKDVRKLVEKVKVGGNTAGGLGIKQGFELASAGFIEGAANQVIIITDGAFNKETVNYLNLIDKYREQGITMSVVGIKNSSNDKLKMIEVAEKGNGRYVPIFKLNDAQLNLIQEIRKASYKG